MKHMKFGILLIIAAFSIAAVASAALNTLSFDRSVTAGQILVDTDDNVAVQISNISKYTDLVKAGPDGKVAINLNTAISNNSSNGFNKDAIFTVGTPSSGVMKIKNNSDIPINVTMANTSNNAISISPAANSSLTIGAGASGDFYFTINTIGQDALKTMNATLHIEAK